MAPLSALLQPMRRFASGSALQRLRPLRCAHRLHLPSLFISPYAICYRFMLIWACAGGRLTLCCEPAAVSVLFTLIDRGDTHLSIYSYVKGSLPSCVCCRVPGPVEIMILIAPVTCVTCPAGGQGQHEHQRKLHAQREHPVGFVWAPRWRSAACKGRVLCCLRYLIDCTMLCILNVYTGRQNGALLHARGGSFAVSAISLTVQCFVS